MSLKIHVLGSGSFGLALSKLLCEAGHSTTLVCRNIEDAQHIKETKQHPRRFKNVMMPPGLYTCADFSTIQEADIIVSALPMIGLRDTWLKAKPYINEKAIIVSSTKGIEAGSNKFANDILHEIFNEKNILNRLVFLSGPSFAHELCARSLTAVTLASHSIDSAQYVQRAISNDYFRAYTSTDVIGVELGGALKNVIALASGIAEGLGYGLNTQAAIVTRGLSEITDLGLKMGADARTLSGLSGLGDLILTSLGGLSRNRSVGIHLGKGETLKDALKLVGDVAEGVNTSLSTRYFSEKYNVNMPIADVVYSVLFEGHKPRDAINSLMLRPLESEINLIC